MIPVAKVKLPTSISDFRPISILSSISKAFERILSWQMIEFLENKALFCNLQSGFRKGHSTSTALLKVIDDIRMNVDSRKHTVLCLLDFSKAFDSVIHGRLYNKLIKDYMFSKSAADLICSYLTGRSQMVRNNDELSEVALVTSGVPQGSILGPLLFSLYIADVCSCIQHSSYHLYADDLQIYRASCKDSASISDCIQLMNVDLSNICVWASDNGLSLNAGKTQSIVVSKSVTNVSSFPSLMVDNCCIPYSTSVRNLGLIISADLKWDDHINLICRKIFYSIRSLWQVTRFADTVLRRKLILTYVFPLFLYSDLVIFGMSGRCRLKLERCFNACLRYVFNLRKFDHLSPVRKRLLGCDLYTFFEFRVCWFIGQLIKYKAPDYLFNKLLFSSNYASNRRLILRPNNAPCSNSSLFVRGIRLWNEIPLSIRGISSREVFRNNFILWRCENA